jgi:CrcB protein
MITLASIAIGGAVGAILRYSLSGWINSVWGGAIYGGTLFVNLVGCFLIGLSFGLFERIDIHPAFRGLTVVGILGAFTTFSSFGLESFILARHQHWRSLAANILLNNVGGLLLVYLGHLVALLIIPPIRR